MQLPFFMNSSLQTHPYWILNSWSSFYFGHDGVAGTNLAFHLKESQKNRAKIWDSAFSRHCTKVNKISHSLRNQKQTRRPAIVEEPQLFPWMERTEMKVLRGQDSKSSQRREQEGRKLHRKETVEYSTGSLWNFHLDTELGHKYEEAI